ncbi:hypothetical protein V6N12_026134 [Hibiscus sabdariffa]|uniref:Uncharacterized protein n=1 Tax=Hibiscus sabdariffa TaxID=183260 RepID=A0ABR2DSI3_9ROSI
MQRFPFLDCNQKEVKKMGYQLFATHIQRSHRGSEEIVISRQTRWEHLVGIYQQFMPHLYEVYPRKVYDPQILKYLTKAFKLSHSIDTIGTPMKATSRNNDALYQMEKP